MSSSVDTKNTITKQETKPGFKQTPLGWIPEDWGVIPFAKIASPLVRWSFTGGPFGSNLKAEDYTESGIRIIQLQNIGDGEFLDTYKIYTSIKKADELLSCNIFSGDIILSKMGDPVARACIMPGVSSRFLMASDGIRLVPDTRQFDTLFVAAYINFSIFRRLAIRNSTGSTRQRIGLDELRQLPFPKINLFEQTAISNVLTTWDNGIRKLQALIDAKITSKKWLMQQLLTGKKRLPGFKGEWKEYHFGELFSERNESNFNHLPLLSIGQDGVYPQTESDKKDTSNSNKSLYRRICPNDIGYNTMRMWQGRSALSSLEGIVSPAYTILVPTHLAHSEYFAYLFKLQRVVHFFFQHSQGLVDDTLNCKYKDFATIKYKIPSTEEQKAIASVLTQSDSEISLIQKNLVALINQKKGLMQQLLTGKKRLNC